MASALRSSVSLSRAVEKSFALEAVVSRLRHHVSVLSRRLCLKDREIDSLRAIPLATCGPCSTRSDTPSGVPESLTGLFVGGGDVASPCGEEVAEVVVRLPSVASSVVAGGVARVAVAHSSDEDVVLGGVIVAGGASGKARKRRSGRKRKGLGTPAVVVEVVPDVVPGGSVVDPVVGDVVPDMVPGGSVVDPVVGDGPVVVPAHFCPEGTLYGGTRLVWRCPCGGRFTSFLSDESVWEGLQTHVDGGCGVEESVCGDDEVPPFGTWLAPGCRLCLGDG